MEIWKNLFVAMSALMFASIFIHFADAKGIKSLVDVSPFNISLLGNEVLADQNNTIAVCQKSGVFCANDCATLMVCVANNTKPLTTVPCSSTKPFCVGNACTAVPDSSCPNAPQYICTEDGVFPEANNCSRSRVCDKGKSTVYECPAGFVFNSNTSVCQQGSTPCSTINCTNVTPTNPYIVYGSNPAFYAVCLNDGNRYVQTIMFKCPYEKFEVFDTKNNTCRFSCLGRAGDYQNPANCSEYYHCSAALNTTVPTLIACPNKHVFDGSTCNANLSTCRNPPRALAGSAILPLDSILP